MRQGTVREEVIETRWGNFQLTDGRWVRYEPATGQLEWLELEDVLFLLPLPEWAQVLRACQRHMRALYTLAAQARTSQTGRTAQSQADRMACALNQLGY